MRHFWKQQRKAERRFERRQRRFARQRVHNYFYTNNYYVNNYGYDPYVNSYGYDPYVPGHGYYRAANRYRYDRYVNDYGHDRYVNDYGYDRPNWAQRIFSILIDGFLNRGSHGDRAYSVFTSYEERRYTRSVYPVYAEPMPPRYYEPPVFVDHSTDYGYEPEYYDAGYSEYRDGPDLGGILGQLPIDGLLSSFAGDGFVSELLSGLLMQGYDEGFLAGQFARENGYGDDYYDNPYMFDGGVCDPYSVSIGENREVLSEGYALGFDDALNEEYDYDPYSAGNGNLVSALLSGLIGRVEVKTPFRDP
ncbi:MAG: hypothetical protein AB7F88_16100 [Pyrinomonadaceae bacterium]